MNRREFFGAAAGALIAGEAAATLQTTTTPSVPTTTYLTTSTRTTPVPPCCPNHSRPALEHYRLCPTRLRFFGGDPSWDRSKAHCRQSFDWIWVHEAKAWLVQPPRWIVWRYDGITWGPRYPVDPDLLRGCPDVEFHE